MTAWGKGAASARKIAMVTRRLFSGPLLFVLFVAQWIPTIPVTATAADWSSWKNFYGQAWVEYVNPKNNAKYAKQMGYDYFAIIANTGVNYYKNDPNCANLKYYIVEPHKWRDVLSNHSMNIDAGKTYTQEEQDWYNQRMVWKSTDSFPNNLATGWIETSSPTKFQIAWDFQQQAVIDEVVNKIITLFHKYETSTGDSGHPLAFAGYMIDVPTLYGDFWRLVGSNTNKVRISYWTGTDSGLVHSAITHEYATYQDGMAAFYKQLNTRMLQDFPNTKWILDPVRIYAVNDNPNEWVWQVSQRSDKDQLTPDFLTQEGGAGTWFVDDSNIFNSGMNITKDMVGISQKGRVEEDQNRLIAAKAGVNGSWYEWFGQLGLSPSPNFQSITEVYPRLKLIRLIPNWDNLNNIPLANRSWDGSVYQSKTADGSLQSYISSDVMYSRHWKTGKIFAVFNTTSTIRGKIKLKAGETITSIQSTDGYFIEAGDATADFTVTDTSNGKEITLNSTVAIPIDSTNGQVKGIGYIVAVTSATGIPAPSITSALSSAGTVGTDFSYQITATNTPTSFSAAGLSAGLSVSTGTGLISGTPTTIGTSSVTISAANAGGTASSMLTLSVYSACDLNRDWATNVVDVQLQVNSALGAAACASDLNRDGVCNVIDVQRGVNAGLGGECLLGP